MHRLVEVNYIIGLEEKANKYAQTLGYNYKSGKWYEQSYKIFNKNYKIKDQVKKDKEKNKKDSLLNKIRSFF